MKNIKRTATAFLLCMLMMLVFTACHSHQTEEWKIDGDIHWRQCSCGEVSDEGEHTFEEDTCTVCGAERKMQNGAVTELSVRNSYGDWTECLYFSEDGELLYTDSAEYTYDKKGNMLTEKIYEDGVLFLSSDFEYDSEGFTFRKYETEYDEDGSRCVCEYNENGDELGYVIYDAEGNMVEALRSEYIMDENGELIGEKVYENDILTREIKYASGKNEEEEYYYIVEEKIFAEDGSETIIKYDEEGNVIG